MLPFIPCQVGETALHMAAKYGKHKIVSLLLKYGADAAIADKVQKQFFL